MWKTLKMEGEMARKAPPQEDPLAVEKRYLKEHIEELAREYPGRYLLIKGEAVHGGFETHDAAVDAGVEKFGRGPFLVRSVLRPDDAETVNIPALAVGVPLVASS